MESKPPQPLKAAIDHFIRVNRMQSKLDEVDVVLAWKECFGNMVNRQTRQLSLRAEGQLWVRLDSGPLKEELLMSKSTVVERLNEHLGRKIVRELVIQ
ncbi:MAG: DUF721 domain-containing protein [Flavobacteriales bacterium]|jgi:hypothetical protein|nr:DUF721 domain-containing protein [Flavobacteriales bacterium]MDG2208943.1 DUF721 domain-containing protein [Flavobacteriales bacterium]